MNPKMRKLLTAVLIVVFILGAGMMVRQIVLYRQADRIAAAADQALKGDASGRAETEQRMTPAPAAPAAPEAQAPLEHSAEFLLDTDLLPLQEINSDVFAWIHIPDTEISFPVVRSYDNEEYLSLSWDRKWSPAGSIFLECKNNRSFLDFNTILYGHHMQDGSVFAGLMQYKNPDYLDGHRYVYIVTEGELRRYEIFAAYEAPIESDTYRLYFPDDATKQTSLEYYVQSSVLDAELVPETDDYILTLSTCTGTGRYTTRWVVQAVLTGTWLR